MAQAKADAAYAAAASTSARTQTALSTAKVASTYTTSAAQLRLQETAALAKAAAGDPKNMTAAAKSVQAENIRIAFQKKLDALKMAELVKRNQMRLALLVKEEQLYPKKAAQYAAQIAAFKQQDALQRSTLSKQNAIALAALQAKTKPSAVAAAVVAATQNYITGPLGRSSINQLSSGGSTLGGVPTLGSVVGAASPVNTLSGSSVISTAAAAASGSAGSGAETVWEKAVINRLEDIIRATTLVGTDVGKAFNGQGRTSATRAAHMTRAGG